MTLYDRVYTTESTVRRAVGYTLHSGDSVCHSQISQTITDAAAAAVTAAAHAGSGCIEVAAVTTVGG